MSEALAKKKNTSAPLLDCDRRKAKRKQYAYLALAFGIPALIMLLIYLVRGHEPIANGSVLVLDLNAQYVYFYEALRDFVWGDSSLLYSFSRSLGGEYLGIYAYYTASPLSYIVALFPKSGILYALLLIIVIKIGLCGLSFGYYLHKKTKELNKTAVVLFSTMYALCAYNIVYQNNIMWLDAVYLLPLLTYSIERLIKRRRFKMFVFTLSLVMLTHYYIGYMLCWYVFFCFFFTYFIDSDRKEANPLGEKLHFIRSLLRITVYSVIAIAISAFMIYAAYYSLQFGKTEFTEPNWELFARFDFLDLFPKLLPGSYDTVMHEGIPNLYCGVLALFMLPVYYLAKKVSSREKIFYTSLVGIYILISVINPADLIMHGFQMPNCLNYRYSFIIVFLLLYMAYKGFCEIKSQTPKIIFAIASALVLMVLVVQKFEYPNLILEDTEYFDYGYIINKLPFLYVITFSLLAIFVIGSILCYLIKTKREKLVSFVLFGAVCLELFGNGAVLLLALGGDVGYSSYSSYNDYFEELYPFTEHMLESDKTFYRAEKTFHRTTNDNMALGLKGLSNSTSTLNEKVISMLDFVGYSADSHWTQFLGSNPISDSLFGVKYIISRKDDKYASELLASNELMGKYYSKYTENDLYISYLNPYSLSIAYGVNPEIKDFDFKGMSYDYVQEEGYKTPFVLLNDLLSTLSGVKEEYFTSLDFDPHTDIEYENTKNERPVSVTQGSEYQFSADDSGNEAGIHIMLTAEKDGPLYMYQPTAYERDCSIYVNDVKFTTIYDNYRIVYLGEFSQGEEIKVSIMIKDRYVCFAQDTPLFYNLDMPLFDKAMAELTDEILVTDEGCSDSHITGRLQTKTDNKMILTTIPYDEGWTVKVDGKAVDIYKTMNDTFIAFDIETAGEHTIELTYLPKLYIPAAIISVGTLTLFLIYCALESIIRRKKQAKCAQENEISLDFAVEEHEDSDQKTAKKAKKYVVPAIISAVALTGVAGFAVFKTKKKKKRNNLKKYSKKELKKELKRRKNKGV